MVQSKSTEPMPGGLKGALVVVWLQAAVNLVYALVGFHENQNDIDHGYTDHSGLLVMASWVTLGIAVLLAACALATAAHQDWARRTVIVLEVLNLLSDAVLVMAGGAVAGLLGMVVAVAVIGGFGSRRTIAWVRWG
ncbi:hypothetical protein [Kitasatospora sp. NPDC097691]|uniref:hypothetical protein n=1 Tax=Kitasatospora sp. NPDC097691 TaxID=3157231 RepID=UPI003318846F